MTRTKLLLVAGGGSLALVAAAWGFQFLGYAPCHLCLVQRIPHYIAVPVAFLALAVGGPLVPLIGALAAASTAGLGLYHTGVEQHWWEGPTTCTSGAIGGMTADDLLAQINAAPLVQCDQVQWAFMGLSMASWNMVLSAVLVAIWVMAARKP